MEKLTKADLTARDAIATELQKYYAALETAVDAFNAAMVAHWDAVQEAMDTYNASVAQANAWLGTIEATIEDYMAERSEQWQDSPRGRAFEAWKEEYAYDQLDEVALEMPDALELAVDDQAESLVQRSEAVPLDL